ncbi:AAA family ATPase [Bartonella queenslandensis]|uniref:AAA family ATPase n=1 Tax=Bartonella queenslandensis TaxID=481138 RepID=UPI0002FAF0B7|nr:AAA family ATPase [Bartonella queenslandensis]
MDWCDFNNVPSQYVAADASPISVDDVRQQLLARLQSVLVHLFPAGRVKHGVFEIGDLQGNKGDSLKVELSGTKAGMWHDFATGEGGDVFALWAACHGLDAKHQFPQVIESIRDWLGLTVSASVVVPQAKPAKYIPEDVLGPYTVKWDYLDGDGKLIACVYRYDTPHGKEFRPWDVLARKHQAPTPRPLFHQPGLSKAQNVVLVEGEKAAEALIKHGITATTAMNGAKAPLDKTDWTPLKGKHVLIWPDHDDAGRSYAEVVAGYLQAQGLVASLTLLEIPSDKPEKWDAADAVAEGLDVRAFLASRPKNRQENVTAVPAFTAGHLLDDHSPMPQDLILPRVLTPGGLMVFAGAPKVGKSDFLLSLLAHMAAGVRFLGMTPPRPLRIFYLQAEIGYHYLRERLQNMAFEAALLPFIRKNLVITPQFKMLLNEHGVAATHEAIRHHFGALGVDIIVVDPLRNVFDGGESDAGENDNAAMLFFLQQRLDALRERVNPDAGIILAHHTRKIPKKQLEEDPFQALSGASSLRGYYTTGLIMFQPEENQSHRQLLFELRNGPPIQTKLIDKINGAWQECDYASERLVKRDYGQQLDAERRRKRDVILEIIHAEAMAGRVYTMNQFCEAFENRAGLGGKDTIRGRLDVLATKGYVKFFKDGTRYGFDSPTRTKYGFLCVEDMRLAVGEEIFDPLTGEISKKLQAVYPTHYKCRQTAAVLPVEDPRIWIYSEEEQA